jgi:hypothetical protein
MLSGSGLSSNIVIIYVTTEKRSTPLEGTVGASSVAHAWADGAELGGGTASVRKHGSKPVDLSLS